MAVEHNRPELVIQKLSKQFGSHLVVDSVDLSIAAGEIFGLIGPNGAGKSTLIKMLATLLPPSAGSADIAGFSIVQAPREVRRRIGYVPQVLSADGSLTGYENLLLSARLYVIPRHERATRIRDASQYSGGMLRRLEIAQSTLHRPQLHYHGRADGGS